MHLIPQSWSHLHLLVSVIPSVGLIFVLGFYIAGEVAKNDVIRRSALALFGILGVLAIPTYFSGVHAMEPLFRDPKISADALNAHYYGSLGALAVLVVTGALALVQLWRAGRPSAEAAAALLGLAGLALVLMVVADDLGFGISHRELERVVPRDQAATATPQAWSHAHIILNHVPTVGFVMTLAFYVIGLIADNDGLKRGALAAFVICSIVCVPTYVTGAASMWALTVPPIPGISKAVINAHRDMALATLFGVGFTGAAAWIGLWRYRYIGRFSRMSLWLVLAFALVTLAIMAETGHRGGQISHPEIRTTADGLPADAGVWAAIGPAVRTLLWFVNWKVVEADGVSPAVELAINNVIWFVPWQTVHFFGFTLIFATVLAVVLRVLGFWKSVPFSAVHRLLPIGMVAVVMNVFTGMLMMLADTYRYVVNDYTFAPKIAFIPIGATAVLYFSLSERLWRVKAHEDAPAFAKAVAVVVLVAWAGVIACGRLLPYL
jgi:uncharacterized membrane protein